MKVIKVIASVIAGTMLLLAGLFVFATVNNARQANRIMTVQEMLKLNHRAVMTYADDNDDRMPGRNWSQVTQKFQERVPEGGAELAPVAMMPGMLHGLVEEREPADVLLVEYAGGTHGGVANDRAKIRSNVFSGGRALSILIDGHVERFETGDRNP